MDIIKLDAGIWKKLGLVSKQYMDQHAEWGHIT